MLVLVDMHRKDRKLLVVIGMLMAVGFNSKVQAQYLKVDTTAYIEWADDLYMNWKDYRFRERRHSDDSGMALTSVIHSVRGGIIKDKPRFEVKVLFVKKDSWTTDSTSITLLAHEKLHFDIAELYGRKIRKQIDELFKQGERDLKIYNKYVKQLLGDFKRFSQNYDRETRHGKDFDQQKAWFDVVYSELDRLKVYY